MNLSIFLSSLAIIFGVVTSHAAYTLNPGCIPASGSFSYFQNFNTLPVTGWQNDSTLAGWILTDSETSIDQAKDKNTGSGGSFYNQVFINSADRALGFMTNNYHSKRTIAFVVQNATGSTVQLDHIEFRGEQWRAGNKTTQTLDFRLLTSSTNPTDMQISTWAARSAGTSPQLDFSTKSDIQSGAILDGKVAPNSKPLEQSLSQNVASGEYLVFLWTEKNVDANNDGMVIDNFSATFSSPTAPIPEPGSVSLFAGSAVVALWARRRRQLPA